MEDARQLWERLIHKPWANPDADFEFVMEALAAGVWVDDVIVSSDWAARSPYRRPLSPIPPGDRYMIDELRALARAPFEAEPWPEPPNVDLSRLTADYERTTGRRVEFSWRWEQYPHAGFWQVDVVLNGDIIGGCGEALRGDPEVDLVSMTDRLQSEHLGEEFDGDWPKCPHHRNFVMLPRMDDVGVACWVCQVDASHKVRIGSLGVESF